MCLEIKNRPRQHSASHSGEHSTHFLCCKKIMAYPLRRPLEKMCYSERATKGKMPGLKTYFVLTCNVSGMEESPCCARMWITTALHASHASGTSLTGLTSCSTNVPVICWYLQRRNWCIICATCVGCACRVGSLCHVYLDRIKAV